MIKLHFQAENVALQAVERIPNANHPQILYWFWKHTVDSDAVLRRLLARGMPFDMIFLTARDGISLREYGRVHDSVRRFADICHGAGIRLGLQLNPQDRPLPAGTPDDQLQSLVTEYEVPLDGRGEAAFTAVSKHVRGTPPARSSLLAAFVFTRTGDGQYAPGSAARLPADCAETVPLDEQGLYVTLHAGAAHAGRTAYVLVRHTCRERDLLAGFIGPSLRETYGCYADCRISASGFDEFGYINVTPKFQADRWETPFREWPYSEGLRRLFEERYHADLADNFFAMRYGAPGEEGRRAAAVNHYFDVLREGPLRAERAHYAAAKEMLGPDAFIAFHNTFHNDIDNDEIWHTGVTWWDLPREYAQTDEDIAWPVRLGMSLGYERGITYDMYYAPDRDRILQKAVRDARYNGRITYHAVNDGDVWGKDLADDDFIDAIRPIERKIRLLNHFGAAHPRADLLILFGFYGQMNWFPDEDRRSYFDLRDGLAILPKAKALWDAGYVCALVPDYRFRPGNVAVAPDGSFAYMGHRFSSLLFLTPEYMHEDTLSLLEQIAAGGGRLMFDGAARRDFDGHDISGRFARLLARSCGTGCRPEDMPRLGVGKNPVFHGCTMEDGGVILTDYEGCRFDTARPFVIRTPGAEYYGTYTGVAALREGADGLPDRFVCAGFRYLYRNGVCLLRSDDPCDMVMRRDADGSCRLLYAPLV